MKKRYIILMVIVTMIAGLNWMYFCCFAPLIIIKDRGNFMSPEVRIETTIDNDSLKHYYARFWVWNFQKDRFLSEINDQFCYLKHKNDQNFSLAHLYFVNQGRTYIKKSPDEVYSSLLTEDLFHIVWSRGDTAIKFRGSNNTLLREYMINCDQVNYEEIKGQILSISK